MLQRVGCRCHASAYPARSGVSIGFSSFRRFRRLRYATAQAPPTASLCSGASGGFAQDRSGAAYHGFTQDRCRRLGYSTASAHDRSRASTTRRVHSHRLHVAGEYAVKIPPIQSRRFRIFASSMSSAPIAFRSPRILVGFRRSNANAQVADPFGFTSFRSQVSLSSLCLLGLLASLYAGDQLPDNLTAPQLSQIGCIALRLPLEISYSG